jgi:hypothetical protein
MAINFPSSPTDGQVFADSNTNLAWVYSSASTAWSASFNRSNYVSQTFTATAGQTSFTVSGGYLPTFVEVYQNGVLLVNGTDVTVTSGTAVVLTVGAVVGDIIQVIGSTTFNYAATMPVSKGGTGLTTLTANNVILGNGTSTPNFVAPGTNGNVLTSNGTTWTSAALSIPAQGQNKSQLFTSSGSWTVPSGVTSVEVQVIAGGGGGAASGYGGCGSAGVTGGSAWGFYTVTPGTTYTVTVGAGGAGTTGTTGTAGGASSFGAFISATGGGAGNPSNQFGTPSSGSGGTLYNSGADTNTTFLFVGKGNYTTTAAQSYSTASNPYRPGDGGSSNGGRGGTGGLVYIRWVG